MRPRLIAKCLQAVDRPEQCSASGLSLQEGSIGPSNNAWDRTISEI